MKRLKQRQNRQADKDFKWWLGGTLCDAPIKAWHSPRTTYQNALASCSDFIWAASKMRQWLLPPLSSTDQVMEMAAQLAAYIIKSTEGMLDAVGDQPVQPLVVVAMVQLGWIKGSEQSLSDSGRGPGPLLAS